MFGTIHLTEYIITVAVLTLYPGQDSIFIMSRSLTLGKKAGIFSALGIISGGFIHAALGTLGLSALLASNGLFFFMRAAGILYLIYLGFAVVLSKKENEKKNSPQETSLPQCYRQGLTVNLLNVKVILFFVSLLPQFIHPDENLGMATFIFLSLIFWITGAVWWLFVAIFTDTVYRNIFKDRRISGMIAKASGVILAAMGFKLLFDLLLDAFQNMQMI